MALVALELKAAASTASEAGARKQRDEDDETDRQHVHLQTLDRLGELMAFRARAFDPSPSRRPCGSRERSFYHRESALSSASMLEARRAAETGVGARERILDASYELFSQRGIRAVGVNEAIERAGVATATLYRHFPSKDELVLAFLQLREQRWTKDCFEAGAISRGSDPERRLLAIFDVFDEWFHREDFEACSFINVMLEMGPEHRAGGATVLHLEQIRSIVRRLGEEARLRDTESLARSFHILMKGSIIAATEGDTDAAQRGKSMARLLIEQHR